MMTTQEARKIQVTKCAMCGSGEIQTQRVTFDSGKQQDVQVCYQCGHYHWPDTEYAYIITGKALNWASCSDLKLIIETVLRKHLPEDIRDLSIEVAELA